MHSIMNDTRRRLLPFVATLALLASASGVRGQDVGLPLGSTPDAAQVEDLEGNAVALGERLRGRPAIVQFWATWCPICEALEPQLLAVKREHGDALAVVIVAVGVNQNPRTIRRHLAQHPAVGEVFYDSRGRAVRAFRAPSTSYVVALDRQGRVV